MEKRLSLNSTDLYLDVSDLDLARVPEAFIEGNNPVLVYMPDLNYKRLNDVEEFAKANNLRYIVLPITLPAMDIVKQAEYAGVKITEKFLMQIRTGIRSAIIKALEGVGA